MKLSSVNSPARLKSRFIRVFTLFLIVVWISGCYTTVRFTGKAIKTGAKGVYRVIRLPFIGLYRGITYPFQRSNDDDEQNNLSMVTSYYNENDYKKTTLQNNNVEQNVLTAAHRTLPLGTMLHVTNPANGKSVLVSINTRVPLEDKYELNLSRTAAERIDILDNSVTLVKVDVHQYPW